MYKLDASQYPMVIRLSDNVKIPLLDGNYDYVEYLAWIAEGNVPEPAFTEAELAGMAINNLISEGKIAIQNLLDNTARIHGFDDLNSIGKYVGYDNAFRFKAEALGGWAASCWVIAKKIQDDVLSGNRAMPTIEQVLSEIPSYMN